LPQVFAGTACGIGALSSSSGNNLRKSFAMRPLRKQRMAAPAVKEKVAIGLPTSGYALVVDGQAKASFATGDQALKTAKDLKQRFPML